MKKILTIATCVLALASCQKDLEGGSSVKTSKEQPIVLSVAGDGLNFDVKSDTRTAAIDAVPGELYWEGTTGTWKSETVKWASAKKSVSGGELATGYYQTNPKTAYNYYVANQAITFAAGGSTVSAANTTDVIAGCTQAATTAVKPAINLDHVFGRTGTLTLTNKDASYTLSDVKWEIASKDATTGTAGTYNIATKGWTITSQLAKQEITSTSDLYITPGVYVITISGTKTKGDFSGPFSVSGDVNILNNKINNITANYTPSDDAEEIILSITLTPWGPNNISLDIVE